MAQPVAGLAGVTAHLDQPELLRAHVRGYLVAYLGGIPLAALTACDVQAMFIAIIRDETAWASGERGDAAPDSRYAARGAHRCGPRRADRRQPGRHHELPREMRPRASGPAM
jgi:hypothetical protein